MAKKRKEGMFTGKARKSMDKPQSTYGYLSIPEDVEIFKPEPDTEVVFDIIPYIVTDPNHLDNKVHEDVAVQGDPHWKRPLKVHKNVGPDNLSIICPTTVGKNCPICEYFTTRKRAGDDWDDIRKMLPSYRHLYAIILTDAQDCEVDYKEDQIYVMEQPDHYFGKALQSALDKDITAENFADPENGLSLQVDFRAGQFGKIEFAEAIKVRFLEREDEYLDTIIDDAPDLDSMMKILPYKEIDALFFGMENMDDEDMENEELEDESSRRRSRERGTNRRSNSDYRSRHRGRRKEEAPEEEPEEEEKKPSRSRSRKTTRKKESEPINPPEEEVDDTDSDPEEEEPSQKSKRSRKTKESEEGDPVKTSRSRKLPKDKCPFGHRFGVDHDQFEDCDKCKIWEDCKEAGEAA